jgi:hypothetical protein
MNDKVIVAGNNMVAVALVFAIAVAAYFFADPMVDVKIYQHLESGEFIYCASGELTGDKHKYIGTGEAKKSKTVHC